MKVLTAIGTTGLVPGVLLVLSLVYLIRQAVGRDHQSGDRFDELRPARSSFASPPNRGNRAP